jgi:hypothetical protein
MKSIRFFLFIFILFLSTNSFSQLSKPGSEGVQVFRSERGYIGINVGPSIPISDFSKSDINNSSSGYAKIGYSIEGNASIRITPIISLGIMSFFNTNSTNLQPIIDYMKSSYPGYSWSGNSNDWHLYGFFGGISYSYPVSPKVSTEMRALGGWLGAKSPELLVSSTSGSDYNIFKIESKYVNTWSYLLAMNIKYKLTNVLSVFGNIEFLGSNPNFRNVHTILNVNGTTVTSNDASFNRKIDALILGIGLRYSF